MRNLLPILAPLFWDKKLTAHHIEEYPVWVLRRVLMFGNRRQVDVGRRLYGDDAIRAAVAHRIVDPRTRNYWNLILTEGAEDPEDAKDRDAPQSLEH